MLVDVISDLDIARAHSTCQVTGMNPIKSAPKLRKQDAIVNCMTMTSDEIYTVYRALYGYLTIFCQWRGKTLLLLDLQPGPKNMIIAPGEILYDQEADRLALGCFSNTCLYASRVQIATRKSLSASAFAHGYHLVRSRL
jgi:methionyl-tRNA formyltransferase